LIGRPIRTIRSFCKRAERDENPYLRAKRGPHRKITEDNRIDVIAELIRDRRLSVRSAQRSAPDARISRETIRKIRHQHGYHYYDSVAVPPLSSEAKARRVAFANQRLAEALKRPVIFTDESTVMQDLNIGGIWRKKGEFVPEGFYEHEAHPCSVMVWGAIGPGWRSELLRCPKSVNAMSYMQMLADHHIFYHLTQHYGGEKEFISH
jgi:hypothetical protein